MESLWPKLDFAWHFQYPTKNKGFVPVELFIDRGRIRFSTSSRTNNVNQREWGYAMEKKDLKKFVAGLSIAGLIAGAGLTMAGCATA